jgi:PhnB protein
MVKLDLCIHFNGNCREAMDFYHRCLGGNLQLLTFAQSPMVSQVPESMRDKIIHSRLEADGMVIDADDVNRTGGITHNISLYMQGSSSKEIEPSFSKLAEGGKIVRPLTQAFFGNFGMINDKFGISWMFRADNA